MDPNERQGILSVHQVTGRPKAVFRRLERPCHGGFAAGIYRLAQGEGPQRLSVGTEKLCTIMPLHGEGIEEYGDGVDVISDPTADVEARVSRKKKIRALRAALLQLDTDSYRLIYALYLSDCRQTERQLAQELGISQSAVHKRKKKILKNLKFLVIKFEKSSQQESERGK